MTAPRCDVAPWQLPREREADPVELDDDPDMYDDGMDHDDYFDDKRSGPW